MDGQKESNGFTFKTFDDGRVEPMPKPGILPFFNYNRYFEWVKLLEKHIIQMVHRKRNNDRNKLGFN